MIANRTILFLHQNFPGQFRHLCAALAERNRVLFLTRRTANRMKGVELVDCAPHRAPDPGIHPYLAGPERAILQGQATARRLIQLRRDGVRPDLIVGHTGWGETLFVKDIFPDVPLLGYFEFFYSATGADVGFDPEFPADPEAPFRLRIRNQAILSALDACDSGLSPTHWQHGRLPAVFRPKISVLHDGIDTDKVRPAPQGALTLPGGLVFDPGVPLVTYVARNLEPYRGFHIFMRAVRPILDRNPDARIVVVGGDEVSYGTRLPGGETYRERALSETALDTSRVHFVGTLPYASYLSQLQASRAHVYLTYPFVLSWSVLEAMAAGCLVVASRTAPVEEVIRHGENGLLVDFFDAEAIAQSVTQALREPGRFDALRHAARRTIVESYDLKRICLPAQLAFLEKAIG